MPKVTFVNENRTVEVASGRTIRDIAAELGITVCAEAFRGTGIGDWTVYVKGAEGALTPPTFMEKLIGIKGWRRLANRAKVLGDVEIWTLGGLPDRLRTPRPISPPPNPSKDPEAKPINEAGSAAFPHGHPHAVGTGTREAIAVGAGKGAKKEAAGGKAAAKESAEEEASE